MTAATNKHIMTALPPKLLTAKLTGFHLNIVPTKFICPMYALMYCMTHECRMRSLVQKLKKCRSFKIWFPVFGA